MMTTNQEWLDKATTVRKGEELNLEALRLYLNANLAETASEIVVEQFPSGFSNLTYLLRLGERQLVLRRPPFGAKKIKSGHDMSREYKVLSRLGKVYPKVPKALLFCEDHAVLGADFYVMERVQGVILRQGMPKAMIPAPKLMATIANGLIDSFAELHAVDYEAAGLGDLGRPKGYVERQIKGWTKRYFRAKTDDIKTIEQAAKWLAENMPAEGRSSLIHNDYKYDNVVLNPNNWSEIVAVLDWEMATLGDPLMDLGTSAAYWVSPDDPPFMQKMAMNPTSLPGNPNRRQIVERYGEKSGRDVSNFLFYYVYGLFKIAVVVQQIYYRYKMGYTQDKRFAQLIRSVQGLSMIAVQAIQKNRIDDLF